MPATPAEVANDLSAQARFFVKRDDAIAKLCMEAARLIRALLAKEKLDFRVYYSVLTRLEDYLRGTCPEQDNQIEKSLRRALETLQTLRAE